MMCGMQAKNNIRERPWKMHTLHNVPLCSDHATIKSATAAPSASDIPTTTHTCRESLRAHASSTGTHAAAAEASSASSRRARGGVAWRDGRSIALTHACWPMVSGAVDASRHRCVAPVSRRSILPEVSARALRRIGELLQASAVIALAGWDVAVVRSRSQLAFLPSRRWRACQAASCGVDVRMRCTMLVRVRSPVCGCPVVPVLSARRRVSSIVDRCDSFVYAQRYSTSQADISIQVLLLLIPQ